MGTAVLLRASNLPLKYVKLFLELVEGLLKLRLPPRIFLFVLSLDFSQPALVLLFDLEADLVLGD